MLDQYSRMMQDSRLLGNRMRSNPAHMQTEPAPPVSSRPTTHLPITSMVATLLKLALERFQKDFAAYERQRREDEKARRQMELERKRVEILERENTRW